MRVELAIARPDKGTREQGDKGKIQNLLVSLSPPLLVFSENKKLSISSVYVHE
jgi:hypothetical protein